VFGNFRVKRNFIVLEKIQYLWRVQFSKSLAIGIFMAAALMALGLPFAVIEPVYFESVTCPRSMSCLMLPPSEGMSPKLLYAIAVSTYCMAISTLVLLVCFPIYMLSDNDKRSEKAGSLVKSSFGFIVGSGSALIGTLSFADI
jgi:predicted PurR-regulated permease PerM